VANNTPSGGCQFGQETEEGGRRLADGGRRLATWPSHDFGKT